MATTFHMVSHTLVAEAEWVRRAWYSRGKGRPYTPGLRKEMTESIARLRLLRELLRSPPADAPTEPHPVGLLGS